MYLYFIEIDKYLLVSGEDAQGTFEFTFQSVSIVSSASIFVGITAATTIAIRPGGARRNRTLKVQSCHAFFLFRIFSSKYIFGLIHCNASVIESTNSV